MKPPQIPASFTLLPITPAKAWMVGLIFGDGCIHRDNGGITLVSADADIPPKIAAITGGTPNLRKYMGKYPHIYMYQRKLWTDLQSEFGLCPNKSKVIRWPENMPDEMLPHFMRGLIDSDGCWSHKGAGRFAHLLQFLYTSVSREFIVGLEHCLRSKLSLPPVKVRSFAITGFASSTISDSIATGIRYSHNASVTLGVWAYKDSTPATRNDRKFQTWLSLAKYTTKNKGYANADITAACHLFAQNV